MSTKTTFKRVALVAVAALGLGVLSVAPSNAAAQLDSLAVSLASTTQKTTETLTATASVLTATLAGTKDVDTLTVTASIVSGPAYVQPILAFKESTTAVASTTTDSSVQTVTPNDTSTITQATAKYSVYLKAPSVVGTYVVKITPTGGVNAAAVTVSIVVSAVAIQGPDATNSELYLLTDFTYNNVVASCGGTCNYSPIAQTSANTVDTRTVTVVAPVGALLGSALWVAKGADTSKVFARTPVTVTVTGPAYVATQSDPQNAYSQKVSSYTETYLVNTGVDPYLNSATSADASIFIYSTGVGGVVTITATMAGVELGKRSFSIIGDATAYVFGTPSKSVVGVTESMTVAVTGADKIGTSTGAASVYAFSSDTSVATVNSTQASTVVVTGVKSGTATITVGNASTLATSTITKTLAVKVGAITAKTVAFSMSPTTPQPGEKVTLTVTATDASGNPVGDGSRNLFSGTGITTSLAVQGATWTANTAAVTLVGGTATYTFYAPTGTGTLEVSATEGSSTDSTTKAAITGSVTITNSAVDAATDAANEAYDAANAATDAALAAAEAADAATVAAQEASDAVAALSESVTKLIAGLQAQIKSLAAVVAKIAKKVKA
jgi:hypothetical protein